MGLDNASIKFCCAARSLGVDFRETLMIGRQQLICECRELQKIFNILGVNSDAKVFLKNNKYGEEFFSNLGSLRVSSLDCNGYEGAEIIHDLNSPVPEALKSVFSVVYDGGTLEHIFDIRQAFKNCMDLVQVGGHFIQVSVANNFMGHGFWQFSPELIYRVFCEKNGFRTKAVILHERFDKGAWYLVQDPEEAKERVLLRNAKPTYILTIAQKVRQEEPFKASPIQSDYVGSWAGVRQYSSNCPGGAKLLESQAQKIWRLAFGKWKINERFKQPYYKPITESDLMLGILGQ
jgi:hypothetical protein